MRFLRSEAPQIDHSPLTGFGGEAPIGGGGGGGGGGVRGAKPSEKFPVFYVNFRPEERLCMAL